MRARIFILGFCWTASSLLEELTRKKPALLASLRVIDFNPQAIERLRRRGVDVVYGDIGQRDVLTHAGIADAEIVICTVPDVLLKGVTNLKLLRQLRDLNPSAKIFIHAHKVGEVSKLYSAGADYVMSPRLLEAEDLLNLLDAADKNLLDQKRKAQAASLKDRDEILP